MRQLKRVNSRNSRTQTDTRITRVDLASLCQCATYLQSLA